LFPSDAHGHDMGQQYEHVRYSDMFRSS